MHELVNDVFYEIIKEYDRTVIDYCLMENDSSDQGCFPNMENDSSDQDCFPNMENGSLDGDYLSHKRAVLFAMGRIVKQYPWITVDEDKATAVKIAQEEMLFIPDKPWKETAYGTTVYNVNFQQTGKIPYWYAFLEPPHGTGPVVRNGKTLRNKYGREDFETVNRALFPKGTDELEVYEWSTDWSSYFDEGKEWWGTICLSIYDKKMNRYTVLMASSTD